MRLEDVARDGRALIVFQSPRREVWAKPAGETRERDVTVFSFSNAMGLSPDGKRVLANVSGVPGEPDTFYLRSTDGSPAKKLGEGFASELSPDGRWAAVVRPGPPTQLVLVPTGAGEEKRSWTERPIEEYDSLNFRWSGDGQEAALRRP